MFNKSKRRVSFAFLAFLILSTMPLLGQRIFFADDGLSATMPNHTVELAQPVQIPVKVTGGNIVSITVAQVAEKQNVHHGAIENESEEGVALGSGEVVRDDGETKTIEIIPLQVGAVNLEIFAMFEDGALARQSYPMIVVPSSKGLRRSTISN